MKVVAGKRRVISSLVDIASSAERQSKLTVSSDRTTPVSLDLARARTPELEKYSPRYPQEMKPLRY